MAMIDSRQLYSIGCGVCRIRLPDRATLERGPRENLSMACGQRVGMMIRASRNPGSRGRGSHASCRCPQSWPSSIVCREGVCCSGSDSEPQLRGRHRAREPSHRDERRRVARPRCRRATHSERQRLVFGWIPSLAHQGIAAGGRLAVLCERPGRREMSADRSTSELCAGASAGRSEISNLKIPPRSMGASAGL